MTPPVPITIEVDPDTARRYAAASAEERARLMLLVNLWLRGLIQPRPLDQVMDEMSAYAQAQGLTPELLEQLLHEG